MKQILLIGNSPDVLKHKFGNKIDNYPLVARFNDFVIEGFEEYVGTMTDIWIKTFKSVKYKGTDFKKTYFNYPPFLANQYASYKEDNVEHISPEFYHKVNDIVGYNKYGGWASSGIVAILFFLQEGYEVTIHGFNGFTSNDLHYYQDNCEMIGHRPELESAALSALINQNKIKILN